MDDKFKNRKIFLINLIYLFAIIALAYFGLKYALGYFAPFLISFLVATALYPMIESLHRKTHLKTNILGAIVAVLFWLIAIFFIVLILYFLTREAINLLGNIGDISVVIQSAAERIEAWLKNLYASFNGASTDFLDASVNSVAESIIEFTAGTAGAIVDFAANIALKLPGVLLFVLVTILSTVFLCGDYLHIRSFLSYQLPTRSYSKYVLIRNFIGDTVGKFIRAYGMIMCLTLCELIFSFLILRINYAVLLALIIAVFDVLPYVGCSTILIPWSMICILRGDPKTGIGLLITSIIIGIVRNAVEPRIVGKQIGLHPLVILISIYIGGKILGLFGILLFPTAIMFLKMLKEEGYIKGWKTMPPDRTERGG